LLESPLSYEIVTSDGQKYPASKEIKHYSGIVKGQSNSLVALTFYRDEIMGFIATDEGNFNISKEKSSGKHLVFPDKNLKEKPHFECGISNEEDEDFEPYDPDILFHEFSASKTVSANGDQQTESVSNTRKYASYTLKQSMIFINTSIIV
jgi:hypothetical protein